MGTLDRHLRERFCQDNHGQLPPAAAPPSDPPWAPAVTSSRLECPQSQADSMPQGAGDVDIYPDQARVARVMGLPVGTGAVQAGPSPGLTDHDIELW